MTGTRARSLVRNWVPRLALLLSIAWTAIVVYEVESKNSTETFAPGPGRFYELYTILSISMFGVVVFAAMAWLVLASVPASTTLHRPLD